MTKAPRDGSVSERRRRRRAQEPIESHRNGAPELPGGPPTNESIDPSGVNARRSAAAIRTYHEAEVIAGTPAVDFCSRVLKPREVQAKLDEVQPLLEVGPIVSGAGETVPALGANEPPTDTRHHLVDTLERPTTVSVRASEKRLELLDQLGLLQSGLDAATTAGAKNSIEKMLCHQLAGTHAAAMNLLAFIPGLGARDVMSGPLPPMEVARLGNSAAKLMDAFAAGCEALRRLRSGGTQRVLVQHQQLVVAQSGAGVVITDRRSKRRRRGGPRARGRSEKRNDR